MDNRIFFKKWGDYNPQESFNLDSIEIKVVITMLEKFSPYINDTDLVAKIGCSPSEIKEIKDKLQALMSVII